MLPKGTRAPRMDDWRNALTGQGQVGRDKRQGGYFAPIALTFDQLALIWQGDDLAARSVETIPKEAKRAGWDLTITDTEDDSSVDTAEMSSEVKDLLTELGCDDALEQAGKYENAYGGGVVLIGANDKQTDLSQPLNLDAVVSLDYLTPLEARACIPRYGYGDPTKSDYGKVETYQLTSRSVLPSRTYSANSCIEVHESRLLVFPGIKVSQYQPLTARSGWGEAQLARTFRVLRDFNSAWAGAGVLVSEFGQKVYKMAQLWDSLKDDGGQVYQDRLEAMDLGASTINATVIDAADDVVRQTTSITGLGDLLDKFAVRLAAACDMPLTLLFGTSPAGMNATGESDIRFFYDRVDAYRQSKLAPNLRRLIKIAYRACGYKIEPKKWSVRFLPLWQESAKDTAAAMLTQAQADVAWITASVLSPEEVAKAHWGKGEYNPHLSIDFAAREAGDQAAAGPVTIADLDAMAPDPEVPPTKPNKRKDEWSEADHPRAPDGKFGDGAAEAASEALRHTGFVEQHTARLSAAGDAARAAFPVDERAHDAAHAAAQNAMHTEAMRIHAEQHAEDLEAERAAKQSIAAGHVTTEVPHAAEDHFGTEHDRIVGEVTNIQTSLEASHQAAADAIGQLNVIENPTNTDLDKVSDLHEVLVDSTARLSEETGRPEQEIVHQEHEEINLPTEPDFDRGAKPDPDDVPDRPESPDHEPDATLEERASAQAEYESDLADWQAADQEYQRESAEYASGLAAHASYEHAVTQHEAEFQRRAEHAQTTLESLHDHQLAAMQRLPQLAKEHDAANASRQAEVERLSSDALVNQHAVAGDKAAQAQADEVSESLLRDEADRRQDDVRTLDLDESRASLKDATKATAAAIKQLAKITGRAPRIPAKAKRGDK